MINNYLKNQIDSSNCTLLPDEIRSGVLSDYNTMSQIGIDNDEDQNKFFLVINSIPYIAKYIFNIQLNNNMVRAIAAEVFKNREKNHIGTLLELIRAIDLALKKMVPENIGLKVAYPQPGFINQLPSYDIGKWVTATREIYKLLNKGMDSRQAITSIIGNWEVKEQMNYELWLKYYKERTPEKYPKLASFGNDGLFLANLPIGINSLRAKTMGKLPNPIESIKEPPGLPQPDVNQARDKIESQRKKLVSRLNSAEKMLASMDGQLFAGDDQELMLKLLQDLKRRIQTANKLTTKSSLFEDQIYRTANILKARGKNSAAGFFYKLAQAAPEGLEMPAMPGLPEMPGLGDTSTPPVVVPSGNETYECIKEFFDNLQRGVSDDNDTARERKEQKEEEAAQTTSPVPAPVPAPAPAPATAGIETGTIKLGRGYWQKTAQMVPEPMPKPPAPVNKPVEIVEEETVPDDNTEDVIEAALRGISINDVVSRLEMLVSIYNKREISRQLAILDLMMDRLGLAAFFPALGEAMSKALESNQYIGSRLEGVLTKLKGSISVPGADAWIEPPVVEMNPETDHIRNNLQQQQNEEAQRKELRKQHDIAKLKGSPDVGPAAVPVGDTQELQQPVARIEKAPKLDVR